MPLTPWHDLHSPALRALDAARTVVVLPVAAVEQHGPHLPLGTDLYINRGILAKAGDRLDPAQQVLVLPEQPVGDSLEHTAYPGTLSLSTGLLLESWTRLGQAVAASGLRKLVIFNSHGGQSALVDQVALRLRVQCRMLVARASYFRFGCPEGLFPAREIAEGLHGGEVETSMMMHLHPELVRREALRDFAPPQRAADALLAPERPVGLGWMAQDLNPAGVVGRAAQADAARGARLLAHLGDCLARVFTELADLPLASLRDAPPAE